MCLRNTYLDTGGFGGSGQVQSEVVAFMVCLELTSNSWFQGCVPGRHYQARDAELGM